MNCNKIILIGIIFLLATSASAATYYIDFENGNDAADGQSTLTAWKHSPGDANSSGNPKNVALNPGDIVMFKGGVVYKGTINLSWPGNSDSNRIVYNGNSTGNWGAGKAIIDGENTRGLGFYANSREINYITIQNFEIRGLKYAPATYSGVGVRFNSSSVGVRLKGLYLHDIGDWSNDGSVQVNGVGIFLLNPIDCQISGNEVTKTGGAGIGISGGRNCTISENNIHHFVNWGIDISSSSSIAATNNTVRNNVIHDLFQYDIGYWGGDPLKVPHQDFIFIRQGAGTYPRPTSNLVESNLFYNDEVFGEAGGTAMVYLSAADKTTIRNNVLINAHSYYAIGVGVGSEMTKIYNNTIYSNVPLSINLKFTELKNNILVGNGLCFIFQAGSFDDLVSNNNYCYPGNSQSFAIQVSPYKAYTFNEWKASGLDNNSIIASSINEMGFIDTSTYPARSDLVNLYIMATSPGVDAGEDLGSAGFSNDYNNVSRPQGSAWDIGAFEHTGTQPRGQHRNDDDLDGVPDAADRCPNTAVAARPHVNIFGCALPIATKFDIRPDFNATDINGMHSLELGILAFGKISYAGKNILLVKITAGEDDRLDIDADLNISQGKITLNQNNLSQLNQSATITLYNTSFTNPKILRDGEECTACKIAAYDRGAKTLVFTAPGF
ncbi:MAG TPA: hypothetical protein HA254_05760 [Candidatus Diapherotrites archaeon]|uniref:Right handed beta helix domain-containing protein n=1 Tax=Candidatus Iainarchaeum sp. TaxID=3101447 RepID=A0A7J4IXC3_9ARCH|nr:hypothetical protein [Candidatus Diapherotrites archaeon]